MNRKKKKNQKKTAILETIFRMEIIGKIYHKHKIREIINCDMKKALEQNF